MDIEQAAVISNVHGQFNLIAQLAEPLTIKNIRVDGINFRFLDPAGK